MAGNIWQKLVSEKKEQKDTISWHLGHLVIVRSRREKRGKQVLFSICCLNSRQARELIFDCNHTKNWLPLWKLITLLHFLLCVPPSYWAVCLCFRNNLSHISITDAFKTPLLLHLKFLPTLCPLFPVLLPRECPSMVPKHTKGGCVLRLCWADALLVCPSAVGGRVDDKELGFLTVELQFLVFTCWFGFVFS